MQSIFSVNKLAAVACQKDRRKRFSFDFVGKTSTAGDFMQYTNLDIYHSYVNSYIDY
jgi:hypothetical protein